MQSSETTSILRAKRNLYGSEVKVVPSPSPEPHGEVVHGGQLAARRRGVGSPRGRFWSWGVVRCGGAVLAPLGHGLADAGLEVPEVSAGTRTDEHVVGPPLACPSPALRHETLQPTSTLKNGGRATLTSARRDARTHTAPRFHGTSIAEGGGEVCPNNPLLYGVDFRTCCCSSRRTFRNFASRRFTAESPVSRSPPARNAIFSAA